MFSSNSRFFYVDQDRIYNFITQFSFNTYQPSMTTSKRPLTKGLNDGRSMVGLGEGPTILESLYLLGLEGYDGRSVGLF